MNRINEIVEEFKHKNFDSFDEFYQLTSKILYVTIHDIVKSRPDTEDLMQDTYMKFLNNIDKCSTSWSPQAYLIKIGKNNAINFYNRMKKVSYADDEYLDTLQEEQEESLGIDLEILELLKDNEKEIVKLHIVGNLKFREIADILDKPLGTILWSYNKAIKYLRKEVSKQYE